MELDDLKEKWKASAVPSSTPDIREALEKKISAIRNSGRGIRRVFYIELAVAALSYVVLLLMAIYFGERMLTYMLKLIIITTIGSLPVIWRLYKSQQWINSIDYGQDMRSNMVAFLGYYRTTLKIYQWSCYLVIAITLVVLYFDHDFMALDMKVRIKIIAYMFAVGVLAVPYIWFLYGRRTSAIDAFLRE